MLKTAEDFKEHPYLIIQRKLPKNYKDMPTDKLLERIRDKTRGEGRFLLLVLEYLDSVATVLPGMYSPDLVLKHCEDCPEPDARHMLYEVFYDFLEKEAEDYIPYFVFHVEGLTDLVLVQEVIDHERLSRYDGQDGGTVDLGWKFLRNVYHQARNELPLLIVGETGTSKSLVAKAVHQMSRRRKGKFVEINCVAIPDNLLESELFGYEKGAFSGAHGKKKGLLETASGGTVFLDELGKMPKPLQAKILKAVESASFTRIGGTKEIHVDVRIVAAMQPHEHDNVYPDLLYRLGYPDTIELPTLQQRLMYASPALLEGVFRRFLKSLGEPDRYHLHYTVLPALQSRAFAGNYRELENLFRYAVRQAKLAKRSEVGPEDFPPPETIDQTDAESRWEFDETPLKDIVDAARKRAGQYVAEVVERKVRQMLQSGGEIKTIVTKEGLPPRSYQNFQKAIQKVTGKGINEMRKMIR